MERMQSVYLTIMQYNADACQASQEMPTLSADEVRNNFMKSTFLVFRGTIQKEKYYLICVPIIAEIGCRSDGECPTSEACINKRCQSPCKCGTNAICDVIDHKANCKCLPGYSGNPGSGCRGPTNPCDPNPCGINAMCEIDNGSPICFCPKGLTGNPFKNCSEYLYVN